MPEMSGYDFIEQVREAPEVSETPIIVLTSGGREGEEALRDRLDIPERLMKPIKQSELFDAIVRTLGVTAPEDTGEYDFDQDDDEPLDHLRVLLAEDNAINQKLAVGVLTRFGHDVTIANNGAEAVEALENEAFDVVLMDVQMPVLDGFGATAAIREKEMREGGHIPIIAMTAHAMKGDREKCIEAGMDEYVAKPIRIGVLKDKLREVLGDSNGDDAGASCEPEQPTDLAAFKNDCYDLEPVRTMVAGNEELLRELLEMYLGESQSLLEEIATAVEAQDAETLQRSGHTLAGASRSVGANVVSEVAQKIQQVGDDGPFEEAQEQLTQLRAAVDGVTDVMKAYLSSGG